MNNLSELGIVEIAAMVAHEANRAYRELMGDTSQTIWDLAPEWQKASARLGVLGIIDHNHTPEESHQSWLDVKRTDGWKYGPVKDPDKKEHPCFVPYNELPEEQRVKDHLFGNVVRGVLSALKKD